MHARAALVVADVEAAGNSWHFGEEGELFQYKFAGRHAVYSGFTSLVLAHELQGEGSLRLLWWHGLPACCWFTGLA